MITYLILYPISYLLTKFIGIFPDSTGFSSSFHNAFIYAGGKLNAFDYMVSLSDLKICLVILVSAEILIWKWETIKWVISHLPFIGGRG